MSIDDKEKSINYNGVTYYMYPIYSDNYVHHNLWKHVSGGQVLFDYKLDDNNIDTLNFEFLKSNDIVEMKIKEDIKNVKIPFSRLKRVNFKECKNINFEIFFDVNISDAISTLHYFFHNNLSFVSSITFFNVNDNLNQSLLKRVCTTYGIENYSFINDENEKKEVIEKKL